jgi:hypothetical protein
MKHFVIAVCLIAVGCGAGPEVERRSAALLPSGTWACEAWNDPWSGYLLVIRQDAGYPSGTYDGACLGFAPGVSWYANQGTYHWPDGVPLTANHNVRFKARRGGLSFQGVFLGDRADGNQGLGDLNWHPPRATWWVAPDGNLYYSPVTGHRVGNVTNMVW